MKVWLAMDPETERVTAQTHPFNEADFPFGKRGRGWPVREGLIDDGIWEPMLRGELPPDRQDAAHRRAWDRASEVPPTDAPVF